VFLDLNTDTINRLSQKYDNTDNVLYSINDIRMMTSKVFNNKLSWDQIKKFGNGVFIDEMLNLEIDAGNGSK
jgi:hypothetical protein